MSQKQKNQKKKSKKKTVKEFGISSWAIDNSTVIYVLMTTILVLGAIAFNTMARENFPEIKETKIYISSVFPGNTAEDIEKFITDPIEDKIKNISNVISTESTSQEDYSIITVEFDEKITVEQAKQKVKDEVDTETSNEDWPTFNGAKVEPSIFDLNISEQTPIMNINLSGDYKSDELRVYAEYLQDKIEDISEIKEANIRGIDDREVEVAVDIYKMMASQVTFDDIVGAISNENLTMSAGNLITSGQRRTIRVLGEIEKPEQLENFVVKSLDGAVYLRDVATVKFKEQDKTTFARKDGKNVVMIDVNKRSGKNMVAAADQVTEIVKVAEIDFFPKDLKVEITNDQSTKTINQVDDLVNNIVFGVILVVGVLMFFLGLRNALFVGFAIPMSMLMSLMVLDFIGYTMNTMILFGLIMGLGMLVDNGIVVVENVYRLMEEEGMSRIEAAKKGIGEIAFPIIISTATTVAAFVPLGMWPGVMGQFMIYFPITLSAVLGASLFIALLINSTIVSQFMKIKEEPLTMKRMLTLTLTMVVIGILFYLIKVTALGTLMLFLAGMVWIYKYALLPAANYFQNKTLAVLERGYEKFLRFALSGRKPYLFVFGTFAMLIIVFMLFGASIGSGNTKVEFFPDNKPNQIFVYIEYPEGTDINKTNEITKEIEQKVQGVLQSSEYLHSDGYNFMVEAAVSQVGEGASNPQTDGGSTAEMPHKGKITVSLREFKFRKNEKGNYEDSEILRQKVLEAVQGIYPGVAISVEKEAIGPPVGYPISIEIKGADYDALVSVAERMKAFINERNIPGIDELKIDVNKKKPGMRVSVDRAKAGELGVSAGQIANQLRNSLFGAKASVYKEDGDDFDIYVRFNEENRYNTSLLFNQNIIFRNQNGQLKEIPLANLVVKNNSSGFSAIKHKEYKRVVTVYSALAPGYTDAGAVVSQIEKEMEGFEMPEGIEKPDYAGQIEEQTNQMIFLMSAFFGGLGLIMFILIFQFNSISDPTIIMIAIFLSFIGVFGGLILTGAPFVIMMTMMGIISLAGVVVNNGVVLLDYTKLLIHRRKEQLGISDEQYLPMPDVKEATIKAGKARLRPVLLTAITTVLGLIPLAIGLNIDFFSLLSELDPKIYIGGDNVIFWGPLAKAVIYGLIIATFLTLVIVPTLFYLISLLKHRVYKTKVIDTHQDELSSDFRD